MLGKKLLAGIAALGVASFAFASGDISYQAPPAPFSPSIYVGAKVGYSISGWENLDTSGNNIPVKNASGLALGIYGGWRMARHFALEAGWTPDVYTVKIGTKPIKASRSGTAEVDGKLIVPFPNVEGVEVYAKLGLAYLYTSRDQRDRSGSVYNLTYGAGLTWAFMPSFGVDAGWSQYHGKPDWNTSYIPTRNRFMLGVYYRFSLQ